MQPVYIILEYCVDNLDAMVCIMQGEEVIRELIMSERYRQSPYNQGNRDSARIREIELSDELLQFFLEFEQKSQGQPNRPYRSYLGRHLGEPVSIVSTVTNETSLGALFNIGSRPSVRGKSFGSQASVYGCKKLYESNKAYVGQLASSMGLQAYTRLGARAGNQYKNMTWSPVS